MLVRLTVVVVDMQVTDLPDVRKERIDQAVGVGMPDVQRDPDPGNSFGESEDLLRVAAEEVPDADHVLDTCKDAVVLCILPDLDECGLLHLPDLLGDEFPHGGYKPRVDRHPVGQVGRVVDAAAGLADGFAPDGIVQRREVQVAVGGVNGREKAGALKVLLDGGKVLGVVQAVLPVGDDLPAGIPKFLDPEDPVPGFPDFR
jgi:hypothetical protein